MNTRYSKSSSSRLGEKYILDAYEWLVEEQKKPDFAGVTAAQMREHLKCSKNMVLSSQCPRYNEVMLKHEKPFRFRVTPGNGGPNGNPARWTLREYKPVN